MASRAIVLRVALLLAIASQAAAQKLDVEIIDRQVSDTSYSYVAPGRINSQSNASANCFDFGNSVNCSGSSTTTGTITPPRAIGYQVRGATFALRLPDGRVAVVNCESKYRPRGDYINRRSCRVPLVNNIRAEFDDDKAKLIWPVSLDGKKTESETYKLLGVVDGQ